MRIQVHGIPAVIVVGSDDLGTWTPTQNDLDAFEAGFPALLTQPPSLTKEEWADLRTKLTRYRRQYTGTSHDGKRALMVTFSCDERYGWGLGPVYINHGGLCYTDVVFVFEENRYIVSPHS